MPETDIGRTTASDLSTQVVDFSVDTESTDGIADQEETSYDNVDWSQNFGYYNTIPELGTVIDAKATWTVGKGTKADEETKFILDGIRGWGKDTWNTIIENMIRQYNIGGDAFCEIIRDDDGNLINLKPLDPEVIRIIVNRQGLIKRYEQRSKVKGIPKKFQPEDIFHLARNRVADQIHGTSMVNRLATIILMRNEAMDDYQRVLHRNIDPMMAFMLDTDDITKIAQFKRTTDGARGKGENLYIPKGAVEFEQLGLAPNATLDPKAWIEQLNSYFYEAANVPKIIVGGTGGITEAAVKIAYLAFQQNVEEEQLFIEEQVAIQLGLIIELEFPVSLENELLSDKQKDGPQNIDASETTAGSGQ